MAIENREAQHRMKQAAEAMQNREHDKCLSILGGILRENPDYAPASRALGAFWMRARHPKNALPFLHKTVELVPDDAEGWKVLGYCCRELEVWTESIRAFQRSMELSGENRELLFELFKINLRLLDYDSASKLIEKLLLIDPESISYRWEYAKLLKEMKREKEALEQYDVLVKAKNSELPDEIWMEWFGLLARCGDPKGEHVWLQEISESSPGNAILKWLYGRSCDLQGDTMLALSLINKAHELSPRNYKIIQSLTVMYRMMGDMEKSEAYLHKSLEIDPLNSINLLSAGQVHRYHYGDNFYKRLNVAEAHMHDFPKKDRTHLHYALGKAYDDVGELETAFEHFKTGGALRSEGRHQDEYLKIRQILKQSKEKLSRAYFMQESDKGCTSDKPLFIVGMPRSGTTLIEQVLSGLDGVYGAGELDYSLDALNHIDINGYKISFPQAYSFFTEGIPVSFKERGERYLELVEALAPEGSRRIIDKMPHNFQWVGLLHLILPNASIIHSRRHPVETCLSAYRLHFARGQHWSDDLKTMGMYYRLYTELMTHWKSVLPEGTILDVRYEDMVNDLEGQSKRLAKYIGVEWNPSCLEFHKKKGTVRTASVAQVRKPIYKDSINRWRKYEPYLKPLLDEIGDLVEVYEAELDDR